MRASHALLAALLPLSVATAACGNAAKDADASGPPALTLEQAKSVLTAYEETNDKANAALDPGLLATVETGPQLEMDTATYKLHQATKKKLSPFDYTDPVFYIPRMTSSPRWFAVDALSQVGKKKVRHALLFVQDKPAGPWKLAADPQRKDGERIKGISLDEDGYAKTPTGGLRYQPHKIADAHAGLLTNGPKSPGTEGLAAGPLTTTTYDQLQQVRTTLTKAGVTFTTQFETAQPETYALRTDDGGAVVWYVLKQQENYSGKNVPVTGDLLGLVPPGKARNLTTTTLIQYLAAIPAQGEVTVSGATRKAVAAETSN